MAQPLPGTNEPAGCAVQEGQGGKGTGISLSRSYVCVIVCLCLYVMWVLSPVLGGSVSRLSVFKPDCLLSFL